MSINVEEDEDQLWISKCLYLSAYFDFFILHYTENVLGRGTMSPHSLNLSTVGCEGAEYWRLKPGP